MHKDIAKEFRASVGTINGLVSKAKRNPKFISELFSKQDLKEKKSDIVEKVVTEMIENDEFIDSSTTVIKKAND